MACAGGVFYCKWCCIAPASRSSSPGRKEGRNKTTRPLCRTSPSPRPSPPCSFCISNLVLSSSPFNTVLHRQQEFIHDVRYEYHPGIDCRRIPEPKPLPPSPSNALSTPTPKKGRELPAAEKTKQARATRVLRAPPPFSATQGPDTSARQRGVGFNHQQPGMTKQ